MCVFRSRSRNFQKGGRAIVFKKKKGGGAEKEIWVSTGDRALCVIKINIYELN